MRLRLKDIREDHELKQKELAEYLNVKQQTYSRYENGKAQPSLEIMEKLSNYYRVSVDYLLGLTDNPKRNI